MVMRYVPMVLVGVLLFVATANGALLFNVTPDSIVVPAGGYNYTTIMVEDTANTTTYILTYVINNPNVTASLSGPYLDPTFTTSIPGVTKTTNFSQKGGIPWTGVAGTPYYFKLNFTSTVAGQSFSCGITATTLTITNASVSVNVNGTVLPGLTVPELGTGILLAAGLVGLALIVSRKY